jgi:VanZ family protein
MVRSVPALVYLGVIHAVSSVPGSELPAVIDDRVAHFFEYFALAVLLYWAVSAFDRAARRWLVCLTVVSFAAAYGMLDELHQSFVPGRDSSLKDVAFDIAGASAAALLVRWLAWREEVR